MFEKLHLRHICCYKDLKKGFFEVEWQTIICPRLDDDEIDNISAEQQEQVQKLEMTLLEFGAN